MARNPATAVVGVVPGMMSGEGDPVPEDTVGYGVKVRRLTVRECGSVGRVECKSGWVWGSGVQIY